jgi:hypothetical protein
MTKKITVIYTYKFSTKQKSLFYKTRVLLIVPINNRQRAEANQAWLHQTSYKTAFRCFF